MHTNTQKKEIARGSCGIDLSDNGVRIVRVSYQGSRQSGLCGCWVPCKSDDNQSWMSALREACERVGFQQDDSFVSCVAGRQVYATALNIVKQSNLDLLTLIKLEIRKSLPFDLAGSSLDFQILEQSDDTISVLAVAAAGELMNQHTSLLASLGITPLVIDVMPIVMRNYCRLADEAMTHKESYSAAIHFGSGCCTLVMQGPSLPFFYRTISIQENRNLDLQSYCQWLADEIELSFSYYRKRAGQANAASLTMLGRIDSAATGYLERSLRIPVSISNHYGLVSPTSAPGEMEIAFACALRSNAVPFRPFEMSALDRLIRLTSKVPSVSNLLKLARHRLLTP